MFTTSESPEVSTLANAFAEMVSEDDDEDTTTAFIGCVQEKASHVVLLPPHPPILFDSRDDSDNVDDNNDDEEEEEEEEDDDIHHKNDEDKDDEEDDNGNSEDDAKSCHINFTGIHHLIPVFPLPLPRNGLVTMMIRLQFAHSNSSQACYSERVSDIYSHLLPQTQRDTPTATQQKCSRFCHVLYRLNEVLLESRIISQDLSQG